MKASISLLPIAALLLVCPLGLSAKIERKVLKTYTVEAGGTLKLDTYAGAIRVSSHADPIVKIEVEQQIDAENNEEADELLSKLQMTFVQEGANVTAVAQYDQKRPSGWSFFKMRIWPPIQLKWTVVVPSTYSIDLDTAGGSISVDDLKGSVRADTSGGSITIGDIQGTVIADTSGGNISLDSATESVKLDTSGGSIKVGTLKGPSVLDTSGGSISVGRAENTLKADTSAGSITVSFAGPIKGDCNLDTSAGGITVKVDETAAFDLVADTSAGRVTCDLPIMVRRSEDNDHLEGKVNGGGPRMRLDTSAGSIRVIKN